MAGTVITFYSFKGGVGRSFTLANTAVLLARWGYRVLCLDWDLEAPGLHEYFRPMMNTDPAGGVVDLVDDFLAGGADPLGHVIRLDTQGVLDFIAAGRDEPGYVRRIQEIDWERLYELGFADYLERCRERWTGGYDFVLLDSRTGVSDTGGICTAHLPDSLIILFTANRQSVRGAVDIAQRANAARDRLPYDRPRLPVLPLLSRFDAREEYGRSEEWRQICLDETKVLFGNWLNHSVSANLISRHLTLPYVSYWSFGEQLPVLKETTPTADQISFALETVAALVAHQFDRTDLLAENRDAYVAAVRARNREFSQDVRVSAPRSALGFANALVEQLLALGVRAEVSMSGDRTLLARAADDARHLCLVVDEGVSRWQSAEVELFLHRTLGQDRRLIPVLTEKADPRALPGYLGNLRFLRVGRGYEMADVARGLTGHLTGAETLTGNEALTGTETLSGNETLTGTATLTSTAELDIAGEVRQAAAGRLSPARWQLVDEIVRALHAAVSAGDDGAARDLAVDLALATRSLANRNGTGGLVDVPPDTRKVIDHIVRLLDTR